MAASVTRYVHVWVAAGLMAAAAVLVTSGPTWSQLGRIEDGYLTALLFLALAGLAEASELRLVRGNSVEAYTLVEAAVVPTLLLLPPGWALLVVLGGVAAGQMARRRASQQLAFNIGQFAVAGAVAVFATWLVRGGGGPLSLRSIAAVMVATVLFGVVNTGAISGIVSRLEGRPVREVLRAELRLNALNVGSNACLGVLVAVLWVHEPVLLPMILAPGFAIHLAYRGLLRSDQLLTEVRGQNIRLDRVVQGATDGIVLLDRHGIVEIWNPSMVSLTGVRPRDAIGRALREVLDVTAPDGKPTDPMAPLAHATPTDPVHTEELELVHRDGGGHRVITTHGFLFDANGSLVGDAVLLRDVTRQREVEHLKDDFLARVTHELRTPLTPIRGFAESILERDDQLDAETRRRMLSRILERTDHMIGLVDDLLLVPQLSGGPDSRDVEIVAPGDLLAVIERVAADLPGPSPDVEISGSPELPDVVVDLSWTELILDNLLSNASKFAPPGSPIEVNLVGEGDGGVAVSVTDHGRGIASDHLDRIFDRFHRTEEPLTMETGGLGIGLYVARQLARRMGGDLEVDSQLGVGSTFTLILSAVAAEGVRRSTTGTPIAAGRPGRAGHRQDRRSGSGPAP